LLKLTLDPDPGYAVKELFFTYNATSKTLYAIAPKYPANHTILVKDLKLEKGTVITLLQGGQTVKWAIKEGGVELNLPAFNPEKMKTGEAVVIKISAVVK